MKKANRRAQREPSKRSLREMPGVDFRTARVKRAKAKGLTLHAALREAILEWARHAA